MEEQAPWYSKHAAAIFGTVFGCLLVTYLNVLHWKYPSVDLTPIFFALVICGLMCFCLAVAVARYWAGSYRDRNAARKALAENNSLKMRIEDLEADMRRANERVAADTVERVKQFNRQMEEHGFFTPLQWEVFRLVREIDAFAKEVGPQPTPENDPAMKPMGNETSQDYLRRSSRPMVRYVDRVSNGYEHRFLERVKTARAKLAERSIKDEWLTNVVESVRSGEQLAEIAERLSALAMKVGA